MFSFVLYDSFLNKLTLCRDLCGEKPLFYAQDSSGFYFSSRVSTFKSIPGFDLSLNSDSLSFYFSTNYIPPTSSVYKNVFALPPFTVLTFDVNLNKQSFYKIKCSPISSLPSLITYQDTKEYFAYLLSKSIARRLRSDVNPALLLSSGLDSSLIASIASEHNHKISAFTYSTGLDNQFNESIRAREISSYLDIDHTIVSINDYNLSNLLSAYPDAFDQPFADQSAIPMLALCQSISTGFKFALGGDGGDEVFGSYTRYKQALISDQILSRISFLPTSILRFTFSGLQRICRGTLLKKLHYLKNSYHHNAYLALIDLYSTGCVSPNKTPEFWQLVQSPTITYSEMVQFDYYNYLPGCLLPKTDCAGMHHGLEIRSPFLSRDLLQLGSILRSGKTELCFSKQIIRDLFPHAFHPISGIYRNWDFHLPYELA